MTKIMTVFGTRPEAIKMAPVVKALEADRRLEPVVVVTAQHRDMLDSVLGAFKVGPHHDLDIMREGQTLAEITAAVALGLERVLAHEDPAMVLVQGDTTTSFVSALGAYYARIPVGHVEAGLRTRSKYSPFPEEMNRRLTGALADLHLAPTERARRNLLAEGTDPSAIRVTGNTVIDALVMTAAEPCDLEAQLPAVDFARRIILVTAHRRENWGERLVSLFGGIRRLVEKTSDVEVVYPVHRNPMVRGPAEEVLGGHPRIHLVDPMDYVPFVHLMKASYIVFTDSGGIQEEAPGLGKPVLVMRDTTERPEAVDAGTVKLVGTDGEALEVEATRLLADRGAYERMARAVNPYGDGKSAPRIVEAVVAYLAARQGDAVASPEETG
jgi:UDP-N-acetylglucosamine 2-epimerase (non-hydrolysing)